MGQLKKKIQEKLASSDVISAREKAKARVARQNQLTNEIRQGIRKPGTKGKKIPADI